MTVYSILPQSTQLQNGYLTLLRQCLELVGYMLPTALEYLSGDWNGFRVYRPAREGRSCEHFGGYKTINRIPLLTANILTYPLTDSNLRHVLMMRGSEQFVHSSASPLRTTQVPVKIEELALSQNHLVKCTRVVWPLSGLTLLTLTIWVLHQDWFLPSTMPIDIL